MKESHSDPFITWLDFWIAKMDQNLEVLYYIYSGATRWYDLIYVRATYPIASDSMNERISRNLSYVLVVRPELNSQ